jgi:hemerythrin-like domain-containing protein
MNNFNEPNNRRKFIKETGILVGLTALGNRAFAAHNSSLFGQQSEDEKVSPSEDLMREHGVLKRVLLIYDEIADRLKNGKDFPPETLSRSADIIRNFIEDYHEKLEEHYLFPRFEKAGKLVDLVRVLRVQHERGRVLTDLIKGSASLRDIKDRTKRQRLRRNIDLFIRMYNPHEAREDTVLFPAFRTLVSSNEYDALGEEFEDEEHKLFGEDGFEKMVETVTGLEKSIDIYDLGKFTPKI